MSVIVLAIVKYSGITVFECRSLGVKVTEFKTRNFPKFSVLCLACLIFYKRNMNVFVELFWTLCHVLETVLWGVIYAILPQSYKDLKNVSGDVALITGAGSGIGRLMCFEFAKRGAVIVALDIDKDANNETKEMIEKKGGVAHAYECNVGYGTVFGYMIILVDIWLYVIVRYSLWKEKATQAASPKNAFFIVRIAMLPIV